jgi:hypothetical protein
MWTTREQYKLNSNGNWGHLLRESSKRLDIEERSHLEYDRQQDPLPHNKSLLVSQKNACFTPVMAENQ